MDFKNILKKIFIYNKISDKNEFELKDYDSDVKYDVRNEKTEPTEKIYKSYDKNYQYIKERFSYPDNNDVVIREFEIFKNTRAFVVFYDGMIDTNSVNNSIIKTLLQIPQFSKNATKEDIISKLVSHSQASVSEEFEPLVDEVNFGGCGLFVDGIDKGFYFDVKNWGHRGIEKPEVEQSLYGPKEAFSEMLRNNSALVRKIVKNEKLICEGTKIGKKCKTRGVIMYISDIANDKLVAEVRRRIDSISCDYIFAIEEVSQFLEDKTFMITNQILETERPDRVARALSEGRVALIINGSPKALIFPTNAFELMHSVSDAYLRYPYANMTRALRLVAMFITVLLPAFYLAITLYHQEMIPTYLAYSISAARENVPFPSVMELLIMDFSFELIREAGIRMPSPIGSTLGIVGGLILGQAAVSAKIVSPLMIIIIAITGIGSFATSDYSLGWSFRILRLIFIALAAFFGFYGIALGLFLYSIWLGSQNSFGVPFLSPAISSGRGSMSHSFFVNPIWKDELRPSFLSPKQKRREPRISNKWKRK